MTNDQPVRLTAYPRLQYFINEFTLDIEAGISIASSDARLIATSTPPVRLSIPLKELGKHILPHLL